MRIPFISATCPICHEHAETYVLDKRIRRIGRLLLDNNRYACRKCHVTWRRRAPERFAPVRTKRAQSLEGISAETRSMLYKE